MSIIEDLIALSQDDNHDGQLRKMSEIIKAEDFAFSQVWYGRHKELMSMIEDGSIEVVDNESTETPSPNQKPSCHRDILESSLKEAIQVENKYGIENLGPWTDYEMGMIHGKLSALRWALGDEWDNLDS